MNENRVLGRALSLEELEQVTGAGGACTPSKDGCADDDGNEVDCPVPTKK